ncbi:hypothetical protein TNIN_434551 [Trichonephila inaurata madagascariensis]|uniref:Uncharacterized protein n=1 Tax=Trichonephila inaurata madagascariensis TaxID=2747483 RepID=A0A8X6YNV8_9ARAC|nr:hypothetical protein TNIN_434551 [Trichonephila inaurata madagascariensis]
MVLLELPTKTELDATHPNSILKATDCNQIVSIRLNTRKRFAILEKLNIDIRENINGYKVLSVMGIHRMCSSSERNH